MYVYYVCVKGWGGAPVFIFIEFSAAGESKYFVFFELAATAKVIDTTARESTKNIHNYSRAPTKISTAILP